MSGLRLMFYDDTCRGTRGRPGLTHSWIAGAMLYGGLGKFHHTRGVHSWDEALTWLATVGAGAPIDEVQYWGHGKWGRVLIDGVSLDASWLGDHHPMQRDLMAVKERMTSDSLWWFRTCETFGADVGLEFARRWTDFFGARAAAHTYIIGPLQSGLHCLRPGEAPDWSHFEGLELGTPDAPKKALWSVPGAPNTITCLQCNLPRFAVRPLDSDD